MGFRLTNFEGIIYDGGRRICWPDIKGENNQTRKASHLLGSDLYTNFRCVMERPLGPAYNVLWQWTIVVLIKY